ncbi:MAG: hypothetical protein COV31_02905 [Candidatus Yanofskybacteria bacterium CG10_big_fil_rev_8_21_14_0_10_46_23]|uniref:Uncharacterized protein n=1 Tax=Candidatus Yanofskybacteria bacterium CG10_big_fil_rev_8_21_14_0_10_46_23 TaxID=1975098 RepID=A0A2H0R3I6_9BACT|nr:MAG: hypothetical protein COV31_02905 [Candidatus Yanofskybacteria bacterium CG10_big_fil_rev_8_21_14_0_10_46_23]
MKRSVLFLVIVLSFLVVSPALGASISNFDINPKRPLADGVLDYNFEILATQAEIENRCGAGFFGRGVVWEIKRDKTIQEASILASGFLNPGQFQDGSELLAGKIKLTLLGTEDFDIQATMGCGISLEAGIETPLAQSEMVRILISPMVTQVTQEFGNPIKIGSFTGIIEVVFDWLVKIAIPIGVIMIVLSGVLMLVSQGNPAKVSQAKMILLYSIIGLAIVLVGKGFIEIIKSFLNLRSG